MTETDLNSFSRHCVLYFDHPAAVSKVLVSQTQITRQTDEGVV